MLRIHTSYKFRWHNAYMKLGIRSRLFFVILITSIIVVIGMATFTRWSIHRGFVTYIEDRQAERIEAISEELSEIYEDSDSWQDIKNNKRLWLSIIFNQTNRLRHQGDHHKPQRPPRAPPHIERLLRNTSNHWPSDRMLRRISDKDHRLPFEVRLMLFDHGKRPIFGRDDQLSQSQLFPIREDGETIGYLALIKGPTLTQGGQLRFLENQHRGLIFIVLGVILLSALISLLQSRRLVKPLQQFREATRELASGNYQRRVEVNRTDELGDLAKDINALGESLEANEQARKQWVADIAHELRTPLTILRGELETIQAGIRPLDEKAIESLHEDTMRLTRLVNDLYELSMSDQGTLNYQKEGIEINPVLQNLIERYQIRYNDKNLKLTGDLKATQSKHIFADSQRLIQLFTNLLENSLRYTDAGGKLEITTTVSQNKIEISFNDSSPGVPEEALPHLFDRLYRVESSRNRTTGGSGLGLAIASNIVTAHDGTISAHASECGGLCIKVSLPMDQRS